MAPPKPNAQPNAKPDRTYTISLANRKPRGLGHERRGEILAAARALLLEHGIENVSTRQIAQRVGISQTALFTYYKSRDEILQRLIEEAFGILGQRLAEAERLAADARDGLVRAGAAYIGFGLEHPDEYRLAFMVIKPYAKPYNAAPEGEPEARQRIGEAVFQGFERQVAAAMDQGVVRHDLGGPKAIAQVLWASLHGLVALLIARTHFPWEDRDRLAAAQVEVLLTGVLARS